MFEEKVSPYRGNSFWFPRERKEGDSPLVLPANTNDKRIFAEMVELVNESESETIKEMDINKISDYLFRTDSMGRFIPADFVRGDEFVTSLASDYKNGAIDFYDVLTTIEDYLLNTIPFHEMLEVKDLVSEDGKFLGFSNMVFPALEAGKGECYEKASLAAAVARNLFPARVVGYKEFPDELWRKIIEKSQGLDIEKRRDLPDFWVESIKHTYPDAITFSDDFTRFKLDEAAIGKLTDRVRLVPKTKPKFNHYWVQCKGPDGWTSIQTMYLGSKSIPETGMFFRYADEICFICYEVEASPDLLYSGQLIKRNVF